MIDAVLRFGKWVGERGREKNGKEDEDEEGEKMKMKGWRRTGRWSSRRVERGEEEKGVERRRRRVERSGARRRVEKNGG